MLKINSEVLYLSMKYEDIKGIYSDNLSKYISYFNILSYSRLAEIEK